jgi:elongation factor Ts
VPVSALGPAALADGRTRGAAGRAVADGEGRVADLVTRLSARTGEHVAIRARGGLAAPAAGVVVRPQRADAATGTIGVLVALDGPAAALAADRPAGGDARGGQRAAVGGAGRHPAAVHGREARGTAGAGADERQAGGGRREDGRGAAAQVHRRVVLLRQPFIIDPDQTVEQALAGASRRGGAVRVRAFVRYASAIRCRRELLSPDSSAVRISTRGATIHTVWGGIGPPLLLLHGSPQTHCDVAQGRAPPRRVVHGRA